MASEADDDLNPQTKKRTITLIFDILLRNPTLCVSINIYIIPSKQLSFFSCVFFFTVYPLHVSALLGHLYVLLCQVLLNSMVIF
jgi:hypothetical protein